MANDQEKEAAARASLRFVKDGQVVGLGTGSTAAYFIRLLGERVNDGLRIRGIPTSERSQELAGSLGIPLTTLDECQEIDLTVDGADEVDEQLRLIKGGGGALLREKIVASATKQLVIVADATKRVPVLGRFPLPVEVIKFAQALVAKRIEGLGAEVRLRREANGNPYLPGVVEHGLFLGMASVVIVASGSETIELRAGSGFPSESWNQG
jgi:ribose 5-phosphate isomerase A